MGSHTGEWGGLDGYSPARVRLVIVAGMFLSKPCAWPDYSLTPGTGFQGGTGKIKVVVGVGSAHVAACGSVQIAYFGM